jgi:hypothetical protein
MEAPPAIDREVDSTETFPGSYLIGEPGEVHDGLLLVGVESGRRSGAGKRRPRIDREVDSTEPFPGTYRNGEPGEVHDGLLPAIK